MTEDEYRELVDFLGGEFGGVNRRLDGVERTVGALERRTTGLERSFAALERRTAAVEVTR